jgi:RNA recognition motif-containing protein
VTQLTPSVNEAHLREILSSDGAAVTFVRLHTQSRHRVSRGTAYVEFKNEHDARAALTEFDGAVVDGVAIKCALRRRRLPPSPRRPRAPLMAPPQMMAFAPPHHYRGPPHLYGAPPPPPFFHAQQPHWTHAGGAEPRRRSRSRSRSPSRRSSRRSRSRSRSPRKNRR